MEVLSFIGRRWGGEEPEGPSLAWAKSFANLRQGANSLPVHSREHFVQRFPSWEQLGQGRPEVFLPDPDPGSAPRAGQRGGVGSAWLALPGSETNLHPLLLLKKIPRLAALRRERRRKKIVEPCKTGISTVSETLLG